MGFAALMPMAHKLGALQYGQMFGDGRLGDPGAAGQRMDRLFAISRQPLENCPARRVGEGFEDGIG